MRRRAAFAAEAALVARRAALRHHVPARPRRARRHHAVRVPRRPLRHRDAASSRRSRARVARAAGAERRTAAARRAHRRRAPLRRLRDADRRSAVHVAVDVGVHHRPVRRVHAGHRGASCTDGSRRRPVCVGIVRRDGRPLPAHRRRRAPRAGRAAHARVRACCSRGTSCTSARTRTVLPPLPFTDACSSAWSRCSRSRRRPGRASARSPRSRCSRSCSPASRAPRSHCRCSSGASSGSRATRAALILLSEPVFAGIAGYVNGERLGAGAARRRRDHPGRHRGLGVLARVGSRVPAGSRRGTG